MKTYRIFTRNEKYYDIKATEFELDEKGTLIFKRINEVVAIINLNNIIGWKLME